MAGSGKMQWPSVRIRGIQAHCTKVQMADSASAACARGTKPSLTDRTTTPSFEASANNSVAVKAIFLPARRRSVACMRPQM